MKRFMLLTIVAALLDAAAAVRADWPQWRGPDRTGVSSGSPALAASWPDDGPPRLWISERIPGGGDGGYGSPVVADGRVYLYVSWKYQVPLVHRTLSEGGLKKLGWRPEGLPAELARKVESARLSEEREALRGNERHAWIDAWVDTHLTADQREAHAGLVKDRLKRGPEALGLDVLATLETIRDREFADEQALGAWFAANGIQADARQAVIKVIPTEINKSNDVVLCLDAPTGEELWKVTWPGRPSGHGTSSTLCVAGGRVYGTGSDGNAFCLDARTGETVWTATVGKGGTNASPLVADGVLVVPMGHLIGLDAASGEKRWEQAEAKVKHSSPTAWRSAGRTFVLSRTGDDLACVDAKTGELRWRAECGGGGDSSPVAAGEWAVVITGKEETGLVGFRISPEAARRAWQVDLSVASTTPVLGGAHLYAFGDRRAVCVELVSGRILWEETVIKEERASPALADGKLVAIRGRSTDLLDASPGSLARLASARLGALRHTSPAIAGGLLVIRQDEALACYDLRAGAK